MTLPRDDISATETAREADLMKRLARGDRTAFGDVIRSHQQRVWAVAFRFTQRAADADDIAQETFLRLWKAAPTWEPAARLSTWLYRVVANLCVDLHRRPVAVALPQEAEQNATPVSAALESQETAARVQQAIAALPERQRMAVILHRFEGLSYQEIAKTTGWGEAAIESLLGRAYASLRTQLEDLRAFVK
jgi:RNA polymerase sigma-70 factor, ECF subfamily